MSEHLHWEPNARTMKALRSRLVVRSRAVRRKRLTGSVEVGFRSAPPLAAGGLHTLSFERSWKLLFGPERIRIEIVDSLSGTESLAGMEEATVYEIRERVSADELRGEWREGPKRGTFRMIRSRERKLVN